MVIRSIVLILLLLLGASAYAEDSEMDQKQEFIECVKQLEEEELNSVHGSSDGDPWPSKLKTRICKMLCKITASKETYTACVSRCEHDNY